MFSEIMTTPSVLRAMETRPVILTSQFDRVKRFPRLPPGPNLLRYNALQPLLREIYEGIGSLFS
ncbi:hypothetical protein Pr1d_43480 [Bythopirellula goksoeyrii]|uniref:Uncharacterized protein n=1 Tax=Bythopirellula goksoeyrii TaxID=1400387 RepID=A0A5B9QDH5_9BACT|nr:hypothetical protein Pr1d_43480 [Bythopirellula goksoeyrii]